MKRCIFYQNYPAELSILKKCRADIHDIVARLHWIPQTYNPLLLCVSELIANTVNYSKAPVASSFSIALFNTGTHLVCEYRDNGGLFDPFKQAVKLEDIDPFAEHGRGIALLAASCETVYYQQAQAPFTNAVICNFKWPHKAIKPSVLLVEDDPAQNYLYLEYLKADYNVLACHTAEEAIATAQQQVIDVVVSDISMPGTNGIELRKTLLDNPTTDLIPFMFLTGAQEIVDSERLAYLGIDDFLQKPVSKQQLITSIERVLQRSTQLLTRVTERLDQHITQALCPKLPNHCLSWAIEYASRNTGAGGGDAVFLEATPQPTLVLLDVMGHDISAKFFAHSHTGYLRGLVKSMTPSFDLQPQFDPAEVLNKLSDMAFADELLSHTILTTLVIELWPNGRFRYASAGHPPPIVVGPNGLKRLDDGGMLPGLMAQHSYSNAAYTLAADERLVLYSDGLFEGASNPSQRQQLEKEVLISIEQSYNLPITQAKEHIMTCFDQQAGSASDDVTLILLAGH